MSATKPSQRLAHIPALDGLRGVAVAGVVAYHLGYLRGGFLGVDLFFVLSGFLITSLLVSEWTDRGRIELSAFWTRRARRLLPALFLVLIGVAAYAAIAAPAIDKTTIRGDGLAALFYVSNWHQIADGTNYFDLVRSPSPLQHLWSLAIEEQFYLVWPLVAILALGRRRRGDDPGNGLTRLLVVSLVLAAASLAWMLHLYHPNGSVSRVYYGTDTRATAILLGAALGITFQRWGPKLKSAMLTGLDFAAIAAACGLGLAWVLCQGTTSWLYRGGMAFTEVLACVVIASIAGSNRGLLSRLLSWGPLTALGRISYGVYLWHWVVIVVLTPSRAGFGGLWLNLVRVLITLALSIASAALVELPIRSGALRGRVALSSVGAAAVACAFLLVVTTSSASTPLDPQIAAERAHPGQLIVATDPARPSTTTTAPTTGGGSVPRSTVPPTPPPVTTLVVGDSGAFYLGEGMDFIGASYNRLVINRGTIGCGIARADGRLRLYDGSILNDPKGCSDYLKRWKVYLAAYKPERVLLVLADVGGGQRFIDGKWRSDCDPVFHSWFQAQAVTALVTLGSTGAKVTVTTVPDIAETQPASATRLVDCRNEALVAAAHVAHSQVIDLRHWACPTPKTCVIKEKDGTEVRPDLVHFLGTGAVIASRWIFGQIHDP
jgi:peptidoglycan/LPS O-acetylase OafA/YrhL